MRVVHVCVCQNGSVCVCVLVHERGERVSLFSEVMKESSCVCANVYCKVSETENKVHSLSRIGGRFILTIFKPISSRDGSFANKSVRTNDSLTWANRPDSPFQFISFVTFVLRDSTPAPPTTSRWVTVTCESLFVHDCVYLWRLKDWEVTTASRATTSRFRTWSSLASS